MSPTRRNFVVGLTVLVALMVLTWMILVFAGRATALFVEKGRVQVTLRTDRAEGVNSGSNVFYRGVNVGQVTAIRRDPDNLHIDLNAEVNNNPPLPHNLVASIRTQSALGGSSAIYLDPDGMPQGQIAPGEVLSAKYVGLSLIPDDVTALVTDLRQERFAQHLDQMILTIKSQTEKAGQVLDSVQKLVSDPKIVADLRAAVGNIRSATEEANRVGAKFETIADNANATVSDVRGAVNKASGGIDNVLRKVSDDTQALGKVLDQFQLAAAKINDGKGTAGLLINDPKLYQSLLDVSRTLNATVGDLQRVVEQWEQEGVPLKLGK